MSSQSGWLTIPIHLLPQRVDDICICLACDQFLHNIGFFLIKDFTPLPQLISLLWKLVRAHNIILANSYNRNKGFDPEHSTRSICEIPCVSLADKIQSKSRFSDATTASNSSRVLGTWERRITGSHKKEVRTSYSPSSDKQARLEEPSLTGLYRLSPRLLLEGEGDRESSRE